MSMDKLKETVYKMIEHHFALLKALRSLEDMIAETKSKEEKIEAFRIYFKMSKTLKQSESDIERYLEIL